MNSKEALPRVILCDAGSLANRTRLERARYDLVWRCAVETCVLIPMSEAVAESDVTLANSVGNVPEILLAIGAPGLEVAQRMLRPGRRIVHVPLSVDRDRRVADVGAAAVLVHSAADLQHLDAAAQAVAHIINDVFACTVGPATERAHRCVALLLEAPMTPEDVAETARVIRGLAEEKPGLVFLACPELYFALIARLTRGEQLVKVDSLTAALAGAAAALVPRPCDGARVAISEALAAELVPLALTSGDSNLDPRCLCVADFARLAEALNEAQAGSSDATTTEEDESTETGTLGTEKDSLAEALTAFRAVVGAKAGSRADDAQFARNLNVSITPLRQTLNPWTQLLWREFEMTLAAPIAAVSAEFVGPTDLDLFNDWVWVEAAGEGRVRLKAVAILHGALRARDLVVEVRIWGRVVARLGAPDEFEHETAGLIGLNAGDNNKAVVEAWSVEQPLLIQVGKIPVEAQSVAGNALTTPAVVRLEAHWPFNRETLTTLPKQGIGQKFTNFRGYAAALRVSSPRLDSLKNARAGQTAWLIGNGPSVRIADLDRLAGRTTFGFNRLYLAYGETRLRPTYTVTGDQQMIEDFGEEIIEKSAGEVFVSAYEAPALSGSYHWIRQARVFPHLFSRDAPRIVTAGGSSLYIAMQIAYWLGIRRFYVYGADFRFAFERLAGADAYRAATGDGNHFIKGYRGGKAWCPPAFETISGAFLAARLLMESEGGFIRNASRGGALEMFERADFDDALAQS